MLFAFRKGLRPLVILAGLSFSPAFASDDCDDLTAGLVDGCPSVASRSGDDNDEATSFSQFFFRNSCDDSVLLAIAYRDLEGLWKSKGWWVVKPGAKFYLRDEGGRRLASNNSVWYYAAICEHKSCRWAGDHRVKLNNLWYKMRQRMNENRRGDNSWGISCVSH